MNDFQRVNRGWPRNLAVVIFLGWVLAGPVEASLSLEQAIALALENDPWLRGSEYRQQALEQSGEAAGRLPDPAFRLGLANLPTDTFDFNQEPMTQLQLGVTQLLPPGDSLALQRQQLRQQGSQLPFERADRRARLAVQVAEQWLDSYRARESIRLIEQDRDLFEHLVEVARSNYASALARTNQQDLVRAQLELTRFEDRLAVLQQRRATADAALGEWLSGSGVFQAGLQLPAELPGLVLQQPQLIRSGTSAEEVAEHLLLHPALQRIERGIAAGDTAVELARQQYRPQWRIDASYGYRDDDPLGRDRADFFSLGVGVQMPLFSSVRQDRQVQSAEASAAALRTEKSLALRRLMADFEAWRARLHYLEQRGALYQSRLLREMREQAEASLAAYTNDTGDFAEVVRAHIAVINARIEALDIEVERLKAISHLNYFFVAGDSRGEASS